MRTVCRSVRAALVCGVTVLAAAPASAQYLVLSPTVVDEAAKTTQAAEAPTAVRPSLFQPFRQVLGDFRHLPTRSNAAWLVAGLAVAASARTADREVTEDFGGRSRTFRPGAVIGSTPLELGSAFATYALGRTLNKPRVTSFGSDLLRAQVMAHALTIGVKQGTRRSRPEGNGFSFPSGHTSTAFASATVIREHFGWKFGAPAYAVATYVAASRIEMRKHYLSDVAFGAALGIVAGRTVTLGHDRRFLVTPIASSNGAGAGVGLTWVGSK